MKSEAGLLKLNCDKAHADIAWFPVLDYSDCVNFVSLWYNKYFEGHEPRLMTDKQIGEYTGLAKQQNRWWAIN